MSTTPDVERWRPIAGFPDYEVSDLGRVLSRKNKKMRVLSGSPHVRGYRVVDFSAGPRVTRRFVHVLVAEAFIGPRPEGMEVRHLNGEPTDNRLANLQWGTHAENVQDIHRHGRNYNSNKTACPKGHPYSVENTRIQPSRPGRLCRACDRERKRAASAGSGRAA